MSEYRERRHKARLEARLKSRKREFLQTLPLIAVGIVAFCVAIQYPGKSISKSNHRVFTDGLRIELDRTSPAFAAMEDTLLGAQLTDFESLATAAEPTVVELLEADRVSATTIAEMILNENRREGALMAQARAAREASAQLMAKAAAEAFERVAAHFSSPQRKPASQPPAAPSAHIANQAPPETKQRLPKAEIEHPTQTIKLAELGMTKDELLREIFLPLATADVSDGPDERMIAGDTGYRSITSRRDIRQPRLGGLDPRRRSGVENASGYPGTGQPNFRNAFDPSNMGNEGMARSKGVVSQGEPPESLAKDAAHQLVIGGKLEFADGLALTNSTDRVVVFRENDGQMLEPGAVWLRDARYEIFVDKPEGNLVAELRTPHGDVLGRGFIELSSLPATKPNLYKLDTVNLRVRPVPQGVVGTVISANTFDPKKGSITGARVSFDNLPYEAVTLKNGRFEEPNLMEGSNVILKAQKAGHWATVAFAASGMENPLRIHPNKMVDAFIALSAGNVSKDTSAIIWGRVTRAGQPTAGARVELLTENDTIKPVYFNALMVPDVTMEATGENGLYAFFPVSPGTHAVQAVMGGAVSEPVLLPAEAQTVSQADVEIHQLQRAKIKVFDAFRTDWALGAELTKLGADPVIQVPRTGEATIHYASGPGVLFMDADGGKNYEPVRISINRDRSSIYVPMVQSKWLDRISGSLRLNKDVRAGTIVGFIQGSAAYEVSMEERSVSRSSKLVYFNSRGELTNRNYGEPGGGFIIFNVPDGFRAVSIQPKGMSKAFATTVLVESKVTNIINHWIR